jgi:NhaP-type Na+/H+ or K+/H+ antiporter
LWQCTFGLFVGFVIGQIANRLLRLSEDKDYIGSASFVVFYLLLAILSIGVGSVLGVDDFLVAFGAGVAFANDGWFSAKTKSAKFPVIIDLLLNSSMFVYFGAIIPWDHFVPRDINPDLGLWQLFVFFGLILLFRRIPIMLAVKRFTPDIKTYTEALFAGHFGPMGLGGLFLAMEARAQLETGTSHPLPKPIHKPPYDNKDRAIEMVWPVICFVVLGSTIVHGLSVAAMSVGGHFSRDDHERAPLIGHETDGLQGMHHDGSDEEDSTEDEGSS